MAIDDLLRTLAIATKQRFADWSSVKAPSAVGVYVVWDQDERLLYVGWAGNLRDRLKSHAIGRRSGNQFCVYVFDRLVLPVLSAEEIHKAAEGLISLDAKVRDYIRKHCSYSLVMTANKDDARSLERLARCGLPSTGKPLLNPL
jgi:predicted GIY-YIG superfamily endonuclease